MAVIMLPLLALMSIIGYHVLIPGEIREYNIKIPPHKFIVGFWPFMVSATFVYLLVQSQATIVNFLGIKVNSDYTSYIMMIEGDMVAHFQTLATPLLTYLNSFVYLIIFPFMVIFTFEILIFTRNVKALEEFTIAFIIIFLTALPFDIFFPVTVPGHVLQGVSPLFYELSPIIDQGVRVVDPFLDNDFPSLHSALSTLVLIIIVFKTNLTRYKIFVVIFTIAILFSTLYLGTNWITSLIAGIILGNISYFGAVKYREKVLLKYLYIPKTKKNAEELCRSTRGTSIEYYGSEINRIGHSLTTNEDPIGLVTSLNNMLIVLSDICANMPDEERRGTCELLKKINEEKLISNKINLINIILGKISSQQIKKKKNIIDIMNPPATIAAFFGFLILEMLNIFPTKYNKDVICLILALLIFFIVFVITRKKL